MPVTPARSGADAAEVAGEPLGDASATKSGRGGGAREMPVTPAQSGADAAEVAGEALGDAGAV